MAVNISAHQIHGGRLNDAVAAALSDAGLDPVSLVLEITEKLVIENYALFREAMQYFVDLGMSFAVDDVGAGWRVGVTDEDLTVLAKGGLIHDIGLFEASFGGSEASGILGEGESADEAEQARRKREAWERYGHRKAFKASHSGRRCTGNVEQNGRDGPAIGRAIIDPR